MNTIKMSAYDVNTNPIDDVLSKDGLQFKSSKPFFLVANYPAKNKTIFEFYITHYYPIHNISHIPLYVGITKEPSGGVMLTKFSISSLYLYNDDPRYDIISNGSEDTMHTYIDGSSKIVGTRKPGAGYNILGSSIDTVGVGVDYDNNRIYLYVNYDENSDEYNAPFYYYDVPFNMRDEGDLYFCIYSNISYKDSLEDGLYIDDELTEQKYISGSVNFGRYGLNHPVPGYTSLYASYYESMAHNEETVELGSDDKPCTIYIGGDSFLDYSKQIDTNVNIENELNPVADELALISPDTTYVDIQNNGLRYIMAANEHIIATKEEDGTDNVYGITNSGEIGSNVFINYPIPTNEKVYFEFTVNDGIPKTKVVGIPISIGLASIGIDKNTPSHKLAITPVTIQEESIRANLYRGSPYQTSGLEESGGNYLCHIRMNSTDNNDKSDLLYIKDVKVSYPLAQGSTIGIGLDLDNNLMTIYSNNTVFAAVYFDPSRKGDNKPYVDFSNFNMKNDKLEYAYFFLHDEGMYRGEVDGVFNFGKSSFSYKVPEGYKSLYDFYNVNRTRIIDKDMDSYITIIANKTVNNYIYGKIYINRTVDIENSINRLIMSNNIITDIYTHYYEINDETYRTMNQIIAAENNSYTPTYKEKSLNVSFEGVPKHTISLAQYSNQILQVTINDSPTIHTEPVITVNENSLIHVSCIAKTDTPYAMNPGTPSITKAIVNSDLFITATSATYKTYNVVVAESPNQTITVYNYRDDGSYTTHTSSFTVNSRYPYIKAEVTNVAKGYTKGVVMPEIYRNKTKVSSDVMLYATSVGNVRYTITLVPTDNETITASYEGTNARSNPYDEVTFTIGYGKPCRISVTPYDGYSAGRAYYYDENNKKVYIGTAIGAVVSDMTIFAEDATEADITILVEEDEHAVTEVSSYKSRDDNLYHVNSGEEITITTKPEQGYYFDHYEITDDSEEEDEEDDTGDKK